MKKKARLIITNLAFVFNFQIKAALAECVCNKHLPKSKCLYFPFESL